MYLLLLLGRSPPSYSLRSFFLPPGARGGLLTGASPGPREEQANGVTASRCAGSYQVPSVATSCMGCFRFPCVHAAGGYLLLASLKRRSAPVQRYAERCNPWPVRRVITVTLGGN